MSLIQQIKDKPWQWGGWLALLIMLTQFDRGLALINSKWNADVLAGEAKATATTAKEKAEGVDEDLRMWIKTQDAVAKALNNYVANQQQQLRQPEMRPIPPNVQRPPVVQRIYRGTTEEGEDYCYDQERWWWPEQRGACESNRIHLN